MYHAASSARAGGAGGSRGGAERHGQISMPGTEEKAPPRDDRRPYMGGRIQSMSCAIGRMDRMLTGRKVRPPPWGRSRRAAVARSGQPRARSEPHGASDPHTCAPAQCFHLPDFDIAPRLVIRPLALTGCLPQAGHQATTVPMERVSVAVCAHVSPNPHQVH